MELSLDGTSLEGDGNNIFEYDKVSWANLDRRGCCSAYTWSPSERYIVGCFQAQKSNKGAEVVEIAGKSVEEIIDWHYISVWDVTMNRKIKQYRYVVIGVNHWIKNAH